MSTGVPQSEGSRLWVVPACTTAVLVGMHMLPGSDLDTDTWWMTWHMDKVLHMIAFSLYQDHDALPYGSQFWRCVTCNFQAANFPPGLVV